MAQYYHIVDWEELPMRKQAALVYGLPQHSRTKARITGGKELSTEEVLLAIIADKLALLTWMQSEDGVNGINQPESVLEILLGEREDNETESFDSPEAFEAERKRLLSGEGEKTG